MTDSDMPKLLFLALVVIALVVLGCSCLFKTTALVEWTRMRYQRSSRLVQAWPFSNLVLRPWFPIYLRWMGVYALLIAIIVAYDAYHLR
jgi:hypothetical protein